MYGFNSLAGTRAVIAPAMTTPINRAMPMSRGRVTNPYSRARRTMFREPSPEQQLSWHSGGFESAAAPLRPDWANSITSSPPSSPVASAMIGRYTANTSPSRA